MRNRYFFKALSLMQFLIFLMFFVSGMYLFAMSKSSRIAEFGDAATVGRNALISLAVSLFFLAPLIGIWRRERWAWWTGLVVNLVCFAISYWALVYKEANWSWDALIGPALFFGTAVLHLVSRPESWKSIGGGDSMLFKKTV